jgi:hypothetical protein
MNAQAARVFPFLDRRLTASQRRESAVARFKDALREFSDDPTEDNAVHYLAASRALDESRRARSLELAAKCNGLPPAA